MGGVGGASGEHHRTINATTIPRFALEAVVTPMPVCET
jgi:hypothetical protein